MRDRDSGYNRDSAWLSFPVLLAAVVSLSLLPYLERPTAQTLGLWTLIAPALAVALELFGGLAIYADSPTSSQSATMPLIRRVSSIGLILSLLTAAIANLCAVAIVWVKTPAETRTGTAAPAALRTSPLSALATSDAIGQFAKAAGERRVRASPSLGTLTPYTKGMLAKTRCRALPKQLASPVTRSFICTLQANREPRWPACRFIWLLRPVYEHATATFATVQSRADVVAKFPTSGYGRFAITGNGTRAPYVGVASVACGGPRLSDLPPAGNLRVAFVLAEAAAISKYRALFRTVGFDWLAAEYFDRPYIAELFALTSLYDVSQIILNDHRRFARTVSSVSRDDLFDSTAIDALRSFAASDLRLGNRSDGQLGNSRGSCLLAMAASNLATTTVRVHIAPSLITRDLSTADRSIDLTPFKGNSVSLPCTLMSALVTRNMRAAVHYPTTLAGSQLRYAVERGESDREAERAGLSIRAAALTLYLLGFEVSYDAIKNPRQVVGSWPRLELVPARP
jgi:hypothetical protein